MYYIFLRFSRHWRASMRLKNGFTLIAEYIMNSCGQRLNAGFERIKNRIDKLKEQFKLERQNQIELEKHEVLNDNDYPKYLSKYRIYITLLLLMVICEGFLNYLTTLIVIPIEEDAELWIAQFLHLARVVLALAATIAAIISVDWVLEEILPSKKLQTYTINTTATPQEKVKHFSWTKLLLGILMLAGIEFAIYNFGLKRAQDFEGAGAEGSSATEALIVLSMIVPIIAGVIWWDINQYRHALLNRKRLEKIRKHLVVLDNARSEAVKRLETYFKLETGAYYASFVRFKIRKEYFNLRKKIEPEDLSSHWCRTEETFEQKAKERTKSHLMEVEESIKLFDAAVGEAGNKLSQESIAAHEMGK